MLPYSDSILWMVVLGFIIAFVLAFGIGANDVANSFGTSVGAGVLTIRQACWLATICEVSGAVLIGFKVSDTMRKGILETSVYSDSEVELMLGLLSALGSSAVWLLIATFFKLPISGTHSIVGSTIGFSLVARGTKGLQWSKLNMIVASWFISPVLSGSMSTCLYWCIRRFILQSSNPLRSGLLALPVFYGVTLFVNVLSIVHDGPKLLHMDNIPTWMAFLLSFLFGAAGAILVQCFVVPWQRRKVLEKVNASTKPVKFTIDGSNESSPGGSPKRAKRPASLVVCEIEKPLAAINESTELVSLRCDGGPMNGNYSDNHLIKNLMMGDFSTHLSCINGSRPNNVVGYQFNEHIVDRVEKLLEKRSLDNPDLTITSLNFIDEQQQQQQHNAGLGGQHIDEAAPPSNRSIRTHFSDPPTNHAIHLEATSSNGGLPVTDLPPMSSAEQPMTGGKLSNNNAQIVGPMVSANTLSPNSSKLPLIESRVDTAKCAAEPEDISTLFSFLQILTAAFGSFAHGGNDVSNAIGPLIAIWMIYVEGTVLQKSETPIWILIFGGAGISLGLWIWGRRVIETVGHDLTKITPSTGFTIEIGAAMTVLLASKIGLPISTTHCKVGSVVFVGYTTSHKNTPEEDAAGKPQERAVDWHLFRNIVYAWVVTVPVAALLSAVFMMILKKAVM